MADFNSDLQGFKPSLPFLLDMIDPNIGPNMNQFTEINQTNIILENSNFNSLQNFLTFSSDNFFSHQTPAEFPGNLTENFPGIFHQNNQHVLPLSHNHHHQQHSFSTLGNEQESEFQESKKRKAILDLSETSSLNSSPQVSECGKRKNNSRRGKKAKCKEEEEEKPKEVVHVRARRGQATDSHSLAERVRRGKINERLRCLQDIVPGCYKTMGMAVMLDEIINYVQSLQNQVEFLSMKLTAASTFYDFNAETDDIETMQRAKAQEAKEMERVMKEGYGGLTNYSQPTWSL
ncbi:hypothetical protein JCGZ_05901 [Jatropha curcas]|uniref:BHLH domain-containing protein n=1 Tax=Jatropha curcas TaxID=180498 RepID=A0A067J8S8_JATCU|nr:transcription factor BEE 3 [Jatropha curcas]KDP20132.1 hypothetical protein JCGZ_05901 [Jatropha curcas]